MIGIFNTNVENKLAKNDDTDFHMEQLLSQPTDPSYPPVQYCYDWEKVYKLIDEGEDVERYIDFEAIDHMKRTLDNFTSHDKLPSRVQAYKSIVDTWG